MATGEQNSLRLGAMSVNKHESLGNMVSPQECWIVTIQQCILARAIVKLATLKLIRQVGGLETRAGIHAAVLRQNFFSKKPQTSALLTGFPTD